LAVLIWMDLEMTGLDVERHVIVEIATLVTDDELNIIAEGPDLVIHQPDEALAEMDDFVTNMHTTSGLLDLIKASTISLEDAMRQTLEFIQVHSPEQGKIPLCGNSIRTDRTFLEKYMPEIEHWLHYRCVDVSTVKELVRRWNPGLEHARPKSEGITHRAMDDIRDSVAELTFYRERVFKSAEETKKKSATPIEA
jgi:oligoribonuclease